MTLTGWLWVAGAYLVLGAALSLWCVRRTAARDREMKQYEAFQKAMNKKSR